MLPVMPCAATPMFVIVGLYAGFVLWRLRRLGAALEARLRQPTIWLFLAFMSWAAICLLSNPVPMRGLQSLSMACLLVFCALLINEFPLSKNAPRLLAIGLSVGSAVIAFDLIIGSRLIDLIHARPDDGVVGRLHPHDNTLQIAAELGVPSLALGFALNARLLWESARFSSSRRAYLLAFFTVVLLFAIISHRFWQSWWWVAVLTATYFLYSSSDYEVSNRKSRVREIDRLIGAPILQAGLTTLVTLWFTKILRSVFFDPNNNIELIWQNLLMGFVATYVTSHFVSFVIRSSVMRAYGYSIPIATIVFSFLAAFITFWRIEYLRLELFLNLCFAIIIISICSYNIESRRFFRFHTFSKNSKEHFQSIETISVSLLDDEQILEWQDSDGIILDYGESLSSDQKKILALSALNGVRTFNETEIIEKFSGSIPVESVMQIAIVNPNTLGLYHVIKRIIDVAAAILLLPFFLLAIIVAGLAIKIDDGGSIFFQQDRIGYKGRKFRVWKLRTMHEERCISGSLYTVENDDRITRSGTLLRRLRIDEFPQIFNIIKGEMSWIGPRPESVPLAEWYRSEIDLYDFRHLVRPGITGWAAVRQGNVGSVCAAKKKLYYDLFYIKNYSFELDLLISLKTIKIIFTGFGAR